MIAVRCCGMDRNLTANRASMPTSINSNHYLYRLELQEARRRSQRENVPALQVPSYLSGFLHWLRYICHS